LVRLSFSNLATTGDVRKWRSPSTNQLSVIVIWNNVLSLVRVSAGHSHIMWLFSSLASPHRRQIGLRPGCWSEWG
jgi:hypothetical protein